MHPGWRRCSVARDRAILPRAALRALRARSSVAYRQVRALLAPCHPGASAPIFTTFVSARVPSPGLSRRGPTLVALLAALGAACRGEPEGDRPTPAQPTAIPPPAPQADERAPSPDRTDREDRAEAEWRRRLDADPRDVRALLGLASVTRSRALRTESLANHLETARLAGMAIEMAPGSVDGYLARAQASLSLHRFAAARDDADRARLLGARSPDLLQLAAELELQLGDPRKARTIFEGLLGADPSPASLVRAAHAAWLLGDLNRAEELSVGAEAAGSSERDGLVAAWLHVQRGVMLRQTGRLEQARESFRKALGRLTGYPPAIEFLAGIEHALGRAEESVRLYRSAVATDPSAEMLSALADALHHQDPAGAAKLVEQADRGFEQQLSLFPEASWHHAAEHYLTHGRADLAAELARLDARARPTAETLALLAEAELAAGNRAAALTATRRLLSRAERTARGFWVAARVLEATEKAEAARHRKEALRLNPRIEALP